MNNSDKFIRILDQVIELLNALTNLFTGLETLIDED
jgi:hypothetical protein